jgi:hypothetical protein
MSNDLHNNGAHGDHGHGDYEREDFSTATVVGSLIGLIVMCVVSFVIVVGMYRYLEKTQMEHVAANPMVPMKADTRHMTPGKNPGDEPMEVQAFPKPRLQSDDVQEMREQLHGEEGRLQSYGWVDQDSGQARIPVSRAMELLAQRGLPVRSATTPEAAPVAASAPGKTKKAGK